jgi:hypothetical protein
MSSITQNPVLYIGKVMLSVADPDPEKLKGRIQIGIRIEVISWIRIRIKGIS